MGRRSSDPGDMLAGIVGEMILGIFAFIGIGIVWLWNALKPTPEQKLQEMKPQDQWGETVQAITCPQCKTENEPSVSHCFSCGFRLRPR